MKILFLVSSLNTGGAERVATTLASAWSRRGDDVTLVSTFPQRGSCFYPLDAGVKLVWIADRLNGARHPLRVTAAKLRALRAMMVDEAPDVVISFLTNVNVMALLAHWGLKVPIVVCERTNPAAARNSGAVLRAMRRLTYPRADVVTVQAKSSVEAFLRMVPGIRRLEVVSNPLPPELLERPLRPAVSAGRKRLMAMGRLVPAKQFDVLIEAFSQLASGAPDWDLMIWGDGPMRDALARQIAGLGMEARISLPGRTESPWDELSKADAFALTSAVEGFPNVLLEAMALGLPCIAFDCPSGPAEMTRHGQDALLIPLGDAAGLREGLQRLMQDPALRAELAGRAAESVRERYALPRVLQRWDEIMKQAGADPATG
ncbi:glycosyltransferase family 4 protein [Pusillimonas noertemannii]|uniref:Glycosyltransferase involved in cell wall biosynthesis n=1 Tax=Pusillimonas noertemannii TaxID=305977 RepID=A0A2U1CM02_9BURK|nr:glycosyltransferase family 4 protein [Pusillimonas noertemannii]NYT68957.1 glycosyltransferase family 4 protein [Pusillimonas noertemannii]PVY62023.1 glycosyltransferase involved in cell wall biosynthesis [Pusillimonas noertemannii]TFL10974.1 glycosyltransferase family 4 protein [Pusillimonas noertemannii]